MPISAADPPHAAADPRAAAEPLLRVAGLSTG